MRKLTIILMVFPISLLPAQCAMSRLQTSLKTTSLESHEGMTITARPWTDPAQYKEKFKKSPYAAGMIAIEVMFRNDSDESMKINLERIRLNVSLSEDDHQSLYPLTPDEVADVITRAGGKDVTARRSPIPLGGPKIGKDKKWLEVQQALQEAGVHSSVVAPHASVKGLLYFDVRSQFDLLNTAHLYVPEIVALEKNHGLMYFEIDLSRSSAS